jgi:hypothetical protein
MNKANTRSRWWRLPDAVWERIEPLLPTRPARDPSLGGRPPGSRPAGHEWHCVRLAHRLSVKRVECDWNLQQFYSPSAVSTVAQGWGL